MFGYVVLNKPEVKIKDFDLYCSFYCGLCQSLKKQFGIAGQLTLSYDLTFVVLLLTGLYEPEVFISDQRCIVHPIHKKRMRQSLISDYAADMNVLLTYYKCLDDWNDEKKYSKKAYSLLLKNSSAEIEKKYPEKAQRIRENLEMLSGYEKRNEKNIDLVAGCFGRIMEEIMVYGDKIWEPLLRRMGFFLGKYIYILDAFDDVEEDIKNKSYNPFCEMYTEEKFEDKIQQLLIMMISECCNEFEKLPIIEYTDLLRNILYSGVWIRFKDICNNRKKQQENKHD